MKSKQSQQWWQKMASVQQPYLSFFHVWTVTETKMDNCVSIEDSHLWLFVYVNGPAKCHVLTCQTLCSPRCDCYNVRPPQCVVRACVCARIWVHVWAKRMCCTDNGEPRAAEYLKWPWTSAFSIPMAAGTVSVSVSLCMCVWGEEQWGFALCLCT